MVNKTEKTLDEAKEMMSDEIGELYSELDQLKKQLKKTAKKTEKETSNFVKERPIKSLLGALAAGVLAGYFIKKLG